jgi:ABC-2 type transport system ATP-binding protein
MIRFERVSKAFRRRTALQDVILEIPEGKAVGLLGANGAGKSTLLGVALGLVRPDRGEVFIRGHSLRKARQKALRDVGAVFEQAGFCMEFSGRENLVMLADYSGGAGAHEIDEVVRFVGLEMRIHDRVATYSRGMRLRLAIAQALLPRPKIILLDEPMEGLDPVGIRDISDLIKRLRDAWGASVVLSSHLLAEIEPLCDSIAVLHEGRLVFAGPWRNPDAIRRFRLEVDDWEAAARVLEPMGVNIKESGIIVLEDDRETADVLKALVLAGVRVHGLESQRITLEQRYLELLAEKGECL